jgi:DNA polymerase-3 subunit delta'
LGQGASFERALTQARSLTLHHGLVIEGARGSGKTTAARRLALELLAGATADPAAHKRVASGQHPDLHLLAPPEDKVEIPVEAVRDLQTLLLRQPMAGGARVVIIDPADRLNEEGQNALLKTLEEPGTDTFVLLVTSRPEALLATVRSRVVRLRLLPLEEARIRAALAATSADQTRVPWAAAVAAGSLGVAQHLVASGELQRLHEQLAEFTVAGATSPHGLAGACFAGVSGRADVDVRARDVLLLLRHVLRQHVLRIAGAPGRRYDPRMLDRWVECGELALAAETDLDLRVNAEQVVLGLLLRVGALVRRTRAEEQPRSSSVAP